jgi:ubiquinone/menaquinone biosynthesis C-methylase UbiE
VLREVGWFVRDIPGNVRLMRAARSQAELYDTLMKRADAAGMAARRAELVGGLRGEILEIGCGTGLMFRHYPAEARVVAIEPDARFRRHAEEAVADAGARIRVETGDGEKLAHDAGRFDAVVIAFVLCSVRSVERVLGECRRVLAAGGELRALEHVRSDGPLSSLLMHAFNPMWRLVNRQGCNMNRRLEAPLERAGFRDVTLEPFTMYSPGLPAFPMQRIGARR